MPKPTARIWSIAAGLLLSTLSPGCAPRPSEPAQLPVAVPVSDRPPAELLACAERPAGLPTDAALAARLPARLRAAMIRLARAFAANAARLDRLVDWHAPGACAGE